MWGSDAFVWWSDTNKTSLGPHRRDGKVTTQAVYPKGNQEAKVGLSKKIIPGVLIHNSKHFYKYYVHTL